MRGYLRPGSLGEAVAWELKKDNVDGRKLVRIDVRDFGIGIDAVQCLDFHMAREEKSNKSNSRCVTSLYFI